MLHITDFTFHTDYDRFGKKYIIVSLDGIEAVCKGEDNINELTDWRNCPDDVNLEKLKNFVYWNDVQLFR